MAQIGEPVRRRRWEPIPETAPEPIRREDVPKEAPSREREPARKAPTKEPVPA